MHFKNYAVMDEKKIHIFCLGLRVFLSDECRLETVYCLQFYVRLGQTGMKKRR